MKYRTDLIRPPQPGDDKFMGDVNTQGIIDTVLYADAKCAAYTKQFAPTLKAAKLFDTCKNIWDFVKTQIPYVLDKSGYQWIKSPGRLWQEKSGDCKSFSVFTASCLKNLGIDYGYRFASYDPDDSTPTHVYLYVPLKKGGEIILDSVWSGPFNTQKQFAHKQDYSMARTHYLGDAGQHRPGELKLTTPIDQLTDGELDLLLMRQRLEIKAMNADKHSIGGISNYGEAIKTINHCIRNVNSPDVICAIGEALEDGYSLNEALSGIGKSAKAAANKKETGKTAAGRLLQKVGKGLKTASKAVVKVVTAPVRLVAKGAMELYLPKAAPFFLYLFASSPDTLPDMMKRKRAKAEKFKNFVIKGIGMKENHFMQIIENALEKRFGKPPAQYLAEKLTSRVSGIDNPKAQWRRECDRHIAGINGPKPKRKQVKPKPVKKLKPAAKPNYNSTLKSVVTLSPSYTPLTPQEVDQNLQNNLTNPTPEKKTFGLDADRLLAAGENLASGNIIGAAMSAISWLISKISSLLKGEKMEPITATDFPDVEKDAANVFDYQDMKEDYSNLTTAQKEQLKIDSAELVERKPSNLWKTLEEKFSYLNKNQKEEVYEEIQTGAEAIDEKEAKELANKISTGGDNTGIIIAAAAIVAVMALSKK